MPETLNKLFKYNIFLLQNVEYLAVKTRQYFFTTQACSAPTFPLNHYTEDITSSIHHHATLTVLLEKILNVTNIESKTKKNSIHMQISIHQ